MGTIPPQANYTKTLTVSGQLINNEERFAGNDTTKIIYHNHANVFFSPYRLTEL